VGAGDAGPRLAAVGGDLPRVAADEELLIVVRIDADLAEVHRPLVLIAQKGRGLAAVVGAEDAALIRIGRRRRGSAATATAATTATAAARLACRRIARRRRAA